MILYYYITLLRKTIKDLVFSTDVYGTLVKRCLPPSVPESPHHPVLYVLLHFDPTTTSLCESSNSDYLLTCDRSTILCERDVEKTVGYFYDSLYLYFAQYVPMSKSNCTGACQPWLDSPLKHRKNFGGGSVSQGVMSITWILIVYVLNLFLITRSLTTIVSVESN